MVVAALGVVFGDIGTSPLYALRRPFTHGQGGATAERHVVLACRRSLIFWSVTSR